jgi:hypothetical protein
MELAPLKEAIVVEEIITSLLVSLSVASASPAEPCQQLTAEIVHGYVDTIMALPSERRTEGMMRFEDLVRRWYGPCGAGPAVMTESVALDLARLLQHLELAPAVVPLLYEMGRVARPAQPQVHAAYLMHRSELRSRPILIGPGHGSLQALRCLDLKLQTGRRVSRYCRYMVHYPRGGAGQPPAH